MTFMCELVIDAPRTKVIKLFDNSGNLKKWQPGLKSFEHLDGKPRQNGAKSRLLYDMKGREVEMTETVIKRDLPEMFAATYEAKGVWNQVTNRFFETGSGGTRWVAEHEFKNTSFISLSAAFRGKTFQKQTTEDMNRFKTYVEGAAVE